MIQNLILMHNGVKWCKIVLCRKEKFGVNWVYFRDFYKKVMIKMPIKRVKSMLFT